MELTVKLGQPDYGELLTALLPLVQKNAPRRDDGLGRLLAAIVNLPAGTLAPVVRAIPEGELNGILSALVADYEPVLLEKAGELLRQQGIALDLRRLELTQELCLWAEVSNVNYALLAESFLPRVLGEASGLWGQILKAPKFLAKTILSSTPPKKLDEALVNLVNGKSELLCRKLETLAAGRGVHIRVEALGMNV